MHTLHLGLALGLLPLVTLACGDKGAGDDTATPDDGGTTSDGGEDAGLVVHIQPESPDTRDDLTVVFDQPADAVDGDYGFTWFHNGEIWSGSVSTVAASQTTKGDVWTVEVAPRGAAEGFDPATSSVVIENARPEVTELRISPTLPTTEDTLSLVFDAVDPDDDDIDWSIQWSVDGEEQPDLTDATTVDPGWLTPGQEWTVLAVPDDGEAAGEPATTSVSIANQAPSIAGVELSPAAPTASDTLTATVSGAYDPDGQDVQVTVQWYVDGTLAHEETVDGDQATLADAFTKGQAVHVVATPSDGVEEGEPVSSDEVIVANTAPTVSGATIDPTDGDVTTTFACVAGATDDLDGDDLSISYRWFTGGVALTVTTETIEGAVLRKGDRLSCEVVVDDGTDQSEAERSDEVLIANARPSLSGVSFEPDPITRASPITAYPDGEADPDGDPVNYVHSWYVNDELVGTATNVLGASWFERDDQVYVVVTPNDGTDEGDPVTSDTATVSNAVPTLSSVSITPSTPYTDDTLTCHPAGFTDADDDEPVYTYAWAIGGETVAGAEDDTLSYTHTVRDDRVTCTVTPGDGFDEGTARTSSAYTIQNTAPVASAALDSDPTAIACDEVLLTAADSSDLDDDPLTYQWTLASQPAASLSTSEDISSPTDESPSFIVDAAGTFTFQVRVSDGTASQLDAVNVAVSEREENTAPVADAGEDLEGSGYATCRWTGGAWACDDCEVETFIVDASESIDSDGDPLYYRWTTSSPHTRILSPGEESSELDIANLATTYGEDTEYVFTIDLLVVDCAGGSDETSVDLVFTCSGI